MSLFRKKEKDINIVRGALDSLGMEYYNGIDPMYHQLLVNMDGKITSFVFNEAGILLFYVD